MKNLRLVATLFVFASALGACRQDAAPDRSSKRYPLQGTVVSVDPDRREITIQHEDIPGFMPAMTMPFVVLPKDAVLLSHVSPGDEVTATLVVPDSRYWIEDLVVVKKATAAPVSMAAPRAVRFPEVGDPLPDVALVNQDGHAIHTSDFLGRALAVTFVFTRCPLPDFCPLVMKKFAAAHATIEGDPDLRTRTHLLTVSFDPTHDTPAVLRTYGLPWQKSRPPFTQWELATGAPEAIRTLGDSLDLDYSEEDGSFAHNLRTGVFDAKGRLLRFYHGNDWTPEQLVADLRAAAGS
jgi:protein SCO1/2